MNRKSHEMYSIGKPSELAGREIFVSFKDPAVFEQMELEPSSPLDAIMGKLQIGKVDKQQHVNTGTHPSTNAEKLGIKNGKASAEATKPGDHSKSSKPLIGKATSSSPSTRSSVPPSKIKRYSRTRRGGVRSKREDPPQSPQMHPSFWRRGSMGSCDSMSLSSAESMPKKKKKMVISLRPHRSKDLYEAQRNDSELRELMQSKNAASLTIRTVHEKNLVFYGAQRVYIPKSLRETTMDFYRKKYKYKPIERMEEWCYWPRIDRDPRRLFQWKVCVTEPGKEPELLYDSDDYEFPNPRK